MREPTYVLAPTYARFREFARGREGFVYLDTPMKVQAVPPGTEVLSLGSSRLDDLAEQRGLALVSQVPTGAP